MLFSLYLIVSLSRSIWQLYKAGDAVYEVEKLRQVELIRNLELKREIEASNSGDFVERQARDKLNMGRPGEVVLIVPDTGGQDDKKQDDKIIVSEANWRKWVRLFE